MDMLSLVFTISAIVGGGFLVWLSTKPGKKWLENLQYILRLRITEPFLFQLYILQTRNMFVIILSNRLNSFLIWISFLCIRINRQRL